MKSISNAKGCGRWVGAALAACGLLLPPLAGASGWVPLQGPSLGGGVETMLLLSDGTVMAQQTGTSSNWYRLTPGSTGGYTNGQWSTRASMHYTRLYYSSDVLQDGRVFVCGAEYGTGEGTAEIYNPANDAWTIIPVPAGLITTVNTVQSNGANNSGFMDSLSVLLSTGNVLVCPVFPAAGQCQETLIYNPYTNGWSQAFLVGGSCDEDEASLVKLPDDSILVIDSGSQTTERFIPSLNQWKADESDPIDLYDPYGGELGAAFLLPNGNAFFIGSTPYYALYTPSDTTSPGNWFFDGNNPNSLGQPDAPAAMMNNGKVLCAMSPTPTSTNNIFTTPTYFYEYVYNSGSDGTFVQVNAPGGGTTLNAVTYNDRMLDLPDGTVLFTSGGSQLYVYVPDSAPLAAGKPAIDSVSPNSDGTFTLTGTLLNGISQGAAYGDDAQMDSNYPLVQFTSGGTVYYGRTFNWSSTSVQTGSKVLSTEFSVPAKLPPGNCSMVVIANGNASSPVTFDSPVWVDFNYSGTQNGTYEFPYETLGAGVTNVASGGPIYINASTQPSTSAQNLTITKAMTITSVSGPSTIGN